MRDYLGADQGRKGPAPDGGGCTAHGLARMHVRVLGPATLRNSPSSLSLSLSDTYSAEVGILPVAKLLRMGLPTQFVAPCATKKRERKSTPTSKKTNGFFINNYE
jgi:hypothetical protein